MYRLLYISAVWIVLVSAGLAAEVEGVRVWAGPEKTRAVIELDEAVDYRVFTLANPERVVVDLESSTLRSDLQLPAGSGELLAGIRSGSQQSGDLRFVFDLKNRARPKSFLLPPAESYSHRLVIDLHGQSTASGEPVRKAEEIVTQERDIVVAIDAGHGGEDPGAIGPSGAREKDVTLAIAREAAASINAVPGFKAVLVRDGDYYIPHLGRPAKARQHRADFFVSIHADAFPDRRVRGSGVFVLSQRRASSEAAKWLADRENRSDLAGGVRLGDKDDTLAAVLLDLSQSASLEASDRAAEKVLAALERVGKVHKKHVERAPFAVLTSPDIPSVLVETAFITNPDEEKRLKSRRGRERIARAIADGIIAYFEQSPPPGTWVARNGGRKRHIVSRGETLSEIAAKHRISLNRLREANAINGDLVRVGDVLKIPAG
ncbi:MAG: N-acetylmuramoyl-L-alanine amidase [Xanthomonadales bacterium]|nr:N-acetylmuramoyl-L-alanine amidase [Xanthomonadales bacterium]